MTDPRFPRDHLTRRNYPEGGWMPPLVIVMALVWAVVFALLIWRLM
jgi:hypothetical protein